MGRTIHDAIVVTSIFPDSIREAHAKAKSLMTHVTEIIPGMINGYESFMIAPDGSKTERDVRDTAAAARDAFISWVNEQAFDCGDNKIEYAWVQFGEVFAQAQSNTLDGWDPDSGLEPIKGEHKEFKPSAVQPMQLMPAA